MLIASMECLICAEIYNIGYYVKNNMNQGLDLLEGLFIYILTVLQGVFVHNISFF